MSNLDVINNIDSKYFFPNKIDELKKLLKDIPLEYEDFITLNNKFFLVMELEHNTDESNFYVEYISFLHKDKNFNWNKVYFDVDDEKPENIALYLIENNYSLDVIESLFNNGYNPNSYSMVDFGVPLFMQCLHQKQEYIPILLKSGVDVYKTNSLDENFIKYCIDKDDYSLFKSILKDNPLDQHSFTNKELDRIIYGFCTLIYKEKFDNIINFFNELKFIGINEKSRMHDVCKGLFDKYRYPKKQEIVYSLMKSLFDYGLDKNLCNTHTSTPEPILITLIEKLGTEGDHFNNNLINDKLFHLLLDHLIENKNIDNIPWDDWLVEEDIMSIKHYIVLKEKENIINSINHDDIKHNLSKKKRI